MTAQRFRIMSGNKADSFAGTTAAVEQLTNPWGRFC